MREIRNLVSVNSTDLPVAQIFYLSPGVSQDMDGYGTVSLKKEVLNCMLETYSASAKYTREQEQDMTMLHNIDVGALMRSTLSNEVNNSIDLKIHQKILDLATESYKDSFSKWDRRFNKWFKYEPKEFFNTPKEMETKIFLYSNKIVAKNRIRPADFIIIGPAIYESIVELPNFVFNTSEKTQDGLFEYMGNIAGKIKVIMNRTLSYSDLDVIIGCYTLHANEGVHLVLGEEKTDSIDTLAPDLFPEKILRTSLRAAVVNTPKAKLNYHLLKFTPEKHNIFTYLISKIWKRSK